MGVGGQRHDPVALLAVMTRYPLYRRLGGPQCRSGRVQKISPPPGFDPRTVQPVDRRFTGCAIPAHLLILLVNWMFAYVCKHTGIQSIKMTVISPFLSPLHLSMKQNIRVFCLSENVEARCLSCKRAFCNWSVVSRCWIVSCYHCWSSGSSVIFTGIYRQRSVLLFADGTKCGLGPSLA